MCGRVARSFEIQHGLHLDHLILEFQAFLRAFLRRLQLSILVDAETTGVRRRERKAIDSPNVRHVNLLAEVNKDHVLDCVLS